MGLRPSRAADKLTQRVKRSMSVREMKTQSWMMKMIMSKASQSPRRPKLYKIFKKNLSERRGNSLREIGEREPLSSQTVTNSVRSSVIQLKNHDRPRLH